MSMQVGYALLSIRALPFILARPAFGLRLLVKRLLFTITRRFCGGSLRDDVTGEVIFNTQTLINGWAMYAVRELGQSWHRLVREEIAPVVIDVGANIGQFGRLVKSINPTARICSIDPQAEFRRDTEWAYAVAVGENNGKAVLTAGGSWTATTAVGVYEGIARPVRQATLDSIWKEIGSPKVTLLKVDVDGAEADVLAGAKSTLASTLVVIIETNDQALLPRGFSWESINGYDWIGTKQTA